MPRMLRLLLLVPAVTGLILPSGLSRRAVCIGSCGLLSTAATLPASAGGAALAPLRETMEVLDELIAKVESGGSAQDAGYVLRLNSAFLIPASDALTAAAAADSSAAPAADALRSSVAALKAAARSDKGEDQLVAAKGASEAIERYFALLNEPPRKPSQPAFSVGGYFGFFSCEGAGLERVPGSNSCVAPPGKNK